MKEVVIEAVIFVDYSKEECPFNYFEFSVNAFCTYNLDAESKFSD